MSEAVSRFFSPGNITFSETIKAKADSAFGVAYVPPKGTTDGFVCIQSYSSRHADLYFPFTQGAQVASGRQNSRRSNESKGGRS